MNIKLKVKLSCRDDNYQKKYDAILLDRNIIVNDDNILPGIQNNYINFISDYSPVYSEYSKGKVNTRFKYPYTGIYKENENMFHIYAKLNWFQRIKLSFIEKVSVFHKHPISSIALIINVLIGIINVVCFFINFQVDLQKTDSQVSEQQTQLLKQHFEILQRQERYMSYVLSNKIHIDSLTSKDTIKIEEHKSID